MNKLRYMQFVVGISVRLWQWFWTSIG